ncbi:hypothetical protein [uncultured Draconibacterium sp.]|uniref:hypothetical protein n=1 Tax=uncultured Draconibacterium sp. TaxID=1573823 RepID=UPI0029C95598|nr:hypothetical protein [uncultured Draconibacterium sp.]
MKEIQLSKEDLQDVNGGGSPEGAELYGNIVAVGITWVAFGWVAGAATIYNILKD